MKNLYFGYLFLCGHFELILPYPYYSKQKIGNFPYAFHRRIESDDYDVGKLHSKMSGVLA